MHPHGRWRYQMGSTLGQRLRGLRNERGLSQADLAADLVSPSYVSLIEAGKRLPERDVLDGLARKLGCSPQYLEYGVDPEEVTEQRLMLKFADIALANGSTDEAYQQFAQLSEAANDEIRVGAIWGLARTEEARGNLHAAVTHREALLTAARAGAPGAPALLPLLIGRCRLYRDAGDFARSIEVGEAALREVRDLGLEGSEEEIRLASTLVGAYWSRGDGFSAQHLASEVIARAELLGTRTAQGNAYWNASVIAASRGHLTLALDLATRSLALLSESSPELTLAKMRTAYAWLLLRCEPPRIAEADAMLERAHEVATNLSHSPGLGSCETEMARSALLRSHFVEAAQIAERAVARFAGEATPELEDAKIVHGLALLMSGDVDAGTAEVADAAARLEALSAPRAAAQAWRELAEALIKRGRSDEAIDALRKAADCAGARSSSIRTTMVPIMMNA
jgi:transcriptional regulator with XRE-family HTH domain